MDNYAVLWKLYQQNYTGWVGLQGYSIGGDIYRKLSDSLATFRAFEKRIEAHPEWSFLMNPEITNS
jgi:hypothetical protein